MEEQDRHRFKIWDKSAKQFMTRGISACVNPEGQIEPNGERFERVDCTGLRDMEGTLIYEGDILDIQGAKALVEWIDDGWKLVGDGFNGDNLFPQIRSVPGANGGKAMWGIIIGNRYENDVDALMAR